MSEISPQRRSIGQIASAISPTHTAPITIATALIFAHILRPDSIARQSLLADILVLHPEATLQPAMLGSMFVHVGVGHLATNLVLICASMVYITNQTNQLYSVLIAFGSHVTGAAGLMMAGEVIELGNVGGASIAGYGLLGVAAVLFATKRGYSHPWTLSFPAVVAMAELSRVLLSLPLFEALPYAANVTATSNVAHTMGIVAGVTLFSTLRYLGNLTGNKQTIEEATPTKPQTE